MAVRKNNTSSKAIDKDINYYKKKFWKIYFYGLGILALFFLFASWGLFGSMPSFEDLENPDSNLATEIISSDGVVLGYIESYSEFRNKWWCEYTNATISQTIISR
jgi:penicillin-binding protein 1A